MPSSRLNGLACKLLTFICVDIFAGNASSNLVRVSHSTLGLQTEPRLHESEDEELARAIISRLDDHGSPAHRSHVSYHLKEFLGALTLNPEGRQTKVKIDRGTTDLESVARRRRRVGETAELNGSGIHMGMSPFCGTSHNARYWLVTDTCGLFCASFTIFLIVFSQWTVTRHILLDIHLRPAWHVIMFNAIGILALTSHLRAMLSDPGTVPKNAEPLAGDSRRLKEAIAQGASHRKRTKGWCHRCMSYKPPRAHHCNVTGRCVVKLDHYCPWTNNAIGVRNHKFFLLFIWYTFLLCVYALGVLIHTAFISMKTDGPEHFGVSALVVSMCGVLFGLFTSCMLCDQWTVLSTNVAKIDRLKGEELGVSSEVNEVFGGRTRTIHVHWFLPVTVHFPKSVHDDVMGYRLPEPKSEFRSDGIEETKADSALDLESQPEDVGNALLEDVKQSQLGEPVLLHDDDAAHVSLINRSR